MERLGRLFAKKLHNLQSVTPHFTQKNNLINQLYYFPIFF